MYNELKIDYASKGTRFANHIIDILGFYFTIFLFAMIPNHMFELIPEAGSSLGLILIYYFSLFFFYHLVFEYFFGRTLGKFVTGTKVIDENGNKPNFKVLVVRNIIRLIPFDNWSFIFFDQGWHDSISKTYVIYK